MIRESRANPGDDDDEGDTDEDEGEGEGDGGDGDGDREGLAADEERMLVDEATYVCGSCGEQIVVPLDPSAGASQAYVEDCPVCCSPNEVRVEFDEDGAASVSSRPE